MTSRTHTPKPPVGAKPTRRLYVLGATILFVLAMVAVAYLATSPKRPARPPAIAVVRVGKDGFDPATLAVRRGTQVVWTNTDSALHQVVANPYPSGQGLPGLKSEILNNTQTYTYTADTTGTFGYHDQIQPTHNATLVVEGK